MSSASGVEKRSITIPVSTSEGVKERVGTRGYSAYVATAVARQLERDAMVEALARMESATGPVNEAQVAAIMARLGR